MLFPLVISTPIFSVSPVFGDKNVADIQINEEIFHSMKKFFFEKNRNSKKL